MWTVAAAFTGAFAPAIAGQADAESKPWFSQIGTIDAGAIDIRGTGHGQILSVRPRPSGPGDLITLDLRSAQPRVVAKLPSDAAQPLYWDDRHVLFASPFRGNGRGSNGQRTEIVLVDRASGQEVKRWRVDGTIAAATIAGDFVQAIRRNSSGYADSSTIFSLKTLKEVAADGVPGWVEHPPLVFWQDRIVMLYNYGIYLYTNRFEMLRSAPGPVWKSRGQFGCGPSHPKIFGKRLIFTGCGGFAVFDLEKFEIERQIPPFDPSPNVGYDVAGDLLFAVPNGQYRQENNGAIFDLNTGQRLAVLPITGDVIAAQDDTIAVGTFNDRRSLALYRVDLARLRDAGQQATSLLGAHNRARARLETSGNVLDAIDSIESVATAPLLDPATMDPALRPVAVDYAAWLAATFKRRDEGRALLEKLSDALPQDAGIHRRLAGALYLRYLIGGSNNDLVAAQRLIASNPIGTVPGTPATPNLPESLPNSTLRTEELALVAGSCSHPIYLIDGKAFVATSCGSSRISVYDRATWQHLKDISLGDNVRFADVTSSIATIGGKILIAVQDAGPGPRQGNIAVLDPNTLDVTARLTLSNREERDVDSLILLPQGVITCGWDRADFGCVLRDKQNFAVIPSPLDQDGGGDLVSDRVDPTALLKLLSASPTRWGARELKAVNGRWIVGDLGSAGRPELAVRPLTTGDWQPLGAAITALGYFKFLDDGDTAILSDHLNDRERFLLLDFNRDAATTLIEMPLVSSKPLVEAVAGNLLLLGMRRDLLVYDAAKRSIAAYYRDLIVDPRDQGRGAPESSSYDPFSIGALVVEGRHLVVVTNDGRYSRLIDLETMRSQLAESQERFAIAQDLLLGK